MTRINAYLITQCSIVALQVERACNRCSCMTNQSIFRLNDIFGSAREHGRYVIIRCHYLLLNSARKHFTISTYPKATQLHLSRFSRSRNLHRMMKIRSKDGREASFSFLFLRCLWRLLVSESMWLIQFSTLIGQQFSKQHHTHSFVTTAAEHQRGVRSTRAEGEREGERFIFGEKKILKIILKKSLTKLWQGVGAGQKNVKNMKLSPNVSYLTTTYITKLHYFKLRNYWVISNSVLINCRLLQ